VKVFENKALRRIFGQKKDEMVGETGENCITGSLMTSTLRQT
jgi:hypothetical protein